MDKCKTTNFPNGIRVGKCVILEDGTELIIIDSVETVSAPYIVEDEDVVLRVTGTGTVTMPASRETRVTIYAADGTLTLNITPENRPNTITAGNAYTLYYDKTLAGYFVA